MIDSAIKRNFVRSFARWLDRRYMPTPLAAPVRDEITQALNIIARQCDGNEDSEKAYEYIRKLVRQHVPSVNTVNNNNSPPGS